MLLSRVLVGCYRKSIGGKVFFFVVLTIFSFGNIQRTSDLLKLGRGHYRDAVLYMAERTIGSKILVGSDHDIRNEMLLSFYKRFLPAENDLVYLSRKSCSELEPEWFITHSLKKEFEPPLSIKDERGRSYSLARSFRRSGTAGFHWFVYHNESGLYEQKRHN